MAPINLLAFPTEVFLQIAEYLDCHAQYALLRVYPALANHFTSRHLSNLGDASEYNTLLHLLAEYGEADLMRRVLQGSSNGQKGNMETCLNRYNEVTVCPIHLAVEHGHEAVVRLLLEQSAVQVNREGLGYSPLALAARLGHVEIVRLILAMRDDVDVNIRTDNLFMSVCRASYHRKPISILFSERPDIRDDLRCGSGKTPLSYAAYKGHEDVMKLLLARDDIDLGSRDGLGRTALHSAAEQGHANAVRLLLEQNGIDINTVADLLPITPLLMAAEGGHEDVVKLLLERPDVRVNASADRTPLMAAASHGYVNLVKMFLARDDAMPNTRGAHGMTALHCAAADGQVEVVKLFLERDDVDLNAVEVNGWTPLQCAMREGHEAVVALLLEREDIIKPSPL